MTEISSDTKCKWYNLLYLFPLYFILTINIDSSGAVQNEPNAGCLTWLIQVKSNSFNRNENVEKKFN